MHCGGYILVNVSLFINESENVGILNTKESMVEGIWHLGFSSSSKLLDDGSPLTRS